MSPGSQRSRVVQHAATLAKTGSSLAAVAASLLAVAAAGCTEPREAAVPGPTWKDDIGPLLEPRCATCHAGEAPDGAYSLASYRDVLGGGTDVEPNAIAGEASSLLLTRLAATDHRAFLSEDPAEADAAVALLTRWVVEERLAYFHSIAHPPSFVNPADPAFHGKEIAAAGWDLRGCRSCHGDSYGGGDVGVSCLGCHQHTPESCDTCHGAGPTGAPPPSLGSAEAVGAHAAHLGGSAISPPLSCSQCHAVPERLDSVGHVDTDGRADVLFGYLATAREAAPTYDRATRSCSDVACHGAGLDGGSATSPAWGAGPVAGECGSCHGLPPTVLGNGQPHSPSVRCELCHPDAGPLLTISDPELHVNGVVDVIPAVLGCNGCHASPDEPLPFVDTAGRSAPELRSVGAHERHLSPGTFSGGFTCASCHLVPSALGDAGHVDPSPAEVTFATGTGLNGDTLTCNTGCHGSDLDGGPAASPVWNGPQPGLLCGGCHALPPGVLRTGELHPPAGECGSCHGQVIDEQFGWVDKSLHVNGSVETTTP